jgi:hypothetical protein
MNTSDERQRNQAAFRQLRDLIRETYPAGRFVAISGGKIVADAARFDELNTILHQRGEHATAVLVVQAGAEYPETVTIFA